jgi:conserved domain protein
MATKTYREVIKILKANGWVLDRTNGSHEIYKNLETNQTVPIKCTKKDIPSGTVASIERKTGLKF